MRERVKELTEHLKGVSSKKPREKVRLFATHLTGLRRKYSHPEFMAALDALQVTAGQHDVSALKHCVKHFFLEKFLLENKLSRKKRSVLRKYFLASTQFHPSRIPSKAFSPEKRELYLRRYQRYSASEKEYALAQKKIAKLAGFRKLKSIALSWLSEQKKSYDYYQPGISSIMQGGANLFANLLDEASVFRRSKSSR